VKIALIAALKLLAIAMEIASEIQAVAIMAIASIPLNAMKTVFALNGPFAMMKGIAEQISLAPTDIVFQGPTALSRKIVAKGPTVSTVSAFEMAAVMTI